MQPEIIVGILSCLGTLIGTLGGIVASSKLTNYKIDELKEKVNKHNNLIDRMYKIENRVTLLEEEVKK